MTEAARREAGHQPVPPHRVAVRTTARRSNTARSLPVPGDLYHADSYGETLLRSLMRAQLGVTLGG